MMLMSTDSAARVWAVVTSVAPLRVWMFDGGAVVFSASKAAPSDTQENDPEHLKSLGFNLWTQDRASTVVWRCGQTFATAVGSDAFWYTAAVN